MTASFMLSCLKSDASHVFCRLRLTLVALLAMILLPATSAHAEGGIQVKSVVVEATEEGYQFDADFEITLNHKLEHALEKGIVLYFVTELNLVSSRWYWLDERVAQSRVREGLSYYALTRQYRLSRGTFSQNFGTLKEALQALSRVRDRPIIPSTELRPDMEYAVEVRMRLDIAALPKPFQVETLGSRDWDLSTGMLRWKHKTAIVQGIAEIGCGERSQQNRHLHTVHDEGLCSGAQPECGTRERGPVTAPFSCGLRQAGLAAEWLFSRLGPGTRRFSPRANPAGQNCATSTHFFSASAWLQTAPGREVRHYHQRWPGRRHAFSAGDGRS